MEPGPQRAGVPIDAGPSTSMTGAGAGTASDESGQADEGPAIASMDVDDLVRIALGESDTADTIEGTDL